MKKIIAVLLLSAVITAAFASCAQDGGNNADTTASDASADTTAAETTEAKLTDEVPELDFGGADFRIISPRADYYEGRITLQDQTGEVLDDALYARSRAIEERFNIIFSETAIDGDVATTNKLQEAVLAGDDLYDTAFVMERDALMLAQNDYIIPIGQLDYIDLDKPWWSEDINDLLTIGNELYFAVSDMSLTGYTYMMVMVYNIDMAKEFSLDSPVDLIYDGTWTYDKFLEMGTVVTADIDGDGEWTENDRYGYSSAPKQVLPSFWIGAGVQTVSKDSDDIPYFSLEGDEEFATVFNRIYEMTWDSGIWNDKAKFSDGSSLFADASLHSVGSSLREMEDDFGIIFYPKYNEEQDEYHSRVSGGFHVSTVPSTATELEMIGAIIEATSAASHNDVVPAFYEISLKQKYARDEATIEMLDYIMAQRTIDLGDTLWCSQIRDGFLRLNFMANDRNLASAIAANKASIEKTITDAVAVFAK